MTPELERLLADLATIRQIARSPGGSDPLLRLCLVQAQALDRIATWTEDAERLLTAAEGGGADGDGV